ncbi:hypothetical protein SEA_OPIE_46 [Gordonia phage Opie]|nr:hypothetical protein SEA_OPIE_46 [Gordonia phage Opie]
MKLFGSKLSPARSVALTRTGSPRNDRVDLEKRGAGVDLLKKFDKAGLSLAKRGLSGVGAEALLVLDHSGSMVNDYRNGTVQALVERALGFALQVDGDGTIPVIAFDHRVHLAVDVTVANYQGVVDREIWDQRGMGSTDLAGALRSVLGIARDASSPLFVIVVTDGEPNDRDAATKLVVELSTYPVFLKFIAIQEVEYLRKLDDMGGRLVDNADAKFFPDVAAVTDLEFADAMTDEWSTWITEATQAGLLR